VCVYIQRPPKQKPSNPDSEQKEEQQDDSNDSSSTPPFFTDKLVAWDAAAPLGQDFALAVHGQFLGFFLICLNKWVYYWYF
jgi:hypothetical protein